MRERLLVVGGDAAGMSAASQARRMRGPDDLEIVAFERGHFTSFSACGIPYFISGLVKDVAKLIVREPAHFRSEQSIDARIGHEVMEVDLDARRLRVQALESGDERWESFDHLMYATGAIPVRPALSGSDTEGIFGVQTLDDGIAIRRYLEERAPRRAVVIGCGYIGLEMAEACIRCGMDVVLVERGESPMTTLDPDMGALVGDAVVELGVKLFLDEGVMGFESHDGRVAAVVTENRTLPADIVILGLGVRPNAALAQSAGIPLGPTGAVEVDPGMHAGTDGVWAAGDCAEKMDRVTRQPVSIPLGTHANKEGRVAGINIGGGRATFPGVIGTSVAKVCDLEVGRTGLTESQATDAGLEAYSVVVDSRTRAGYYPGSAPIKTKLVVEKGSGRLLGGQIVGKEDAAKRIDILATALWNEMSVGEIFNMDLGYAPPFSPVWDPVLIAARKAADELRGARDA